MEYRGSCRTRQESIARVECGNPDQRACTILERIPSCNAGLSEIRGMCLQTGTCGQAGQRPCEVGERIPSCDANLKEAFHSNRCVALRPGETPFLGGLASLSAYYGDSIRTACKDTLGSLNLNDNTPIGIGAECSKMVFVGASCEYLASALGADTAKTIGGIADTPRQIADAERQLNLFKAKVDQAYAGPACSAFAEKLTPAAFHGRANSFRCAGGQFADPNGNCYSCPEGFTRTLEPVTSPRACVDKPGGELTRSACAVFQASTEDFAKGATCAAEVLSSGAFLTQQIDFNTAGRDFCLATGELTYALTSILLPSKPADQKAQQLTATLDKFLQTLKRTYQRADAIKSKIDQAVTVYDSSANLANKFNALVSCQDGATNVASITPTVGVIPQARAEDQFVVMVRIPGKNYEMGKFEVTQAQWQSVMGNNPSNHATCGGDCPVDKVSWNDIQVFLTRLNQRFGANFRLPTNAEWTFACYGGVNTEHCGSDNVDAIAWYGGNAVSQERPTHPVGQKQPNPYGLYDMNGNVWEWVSDCNDRQCTPNKRNLRGGGWINSKEDLRVAKRNRGNLDEGYWESGFRLARSVSDGEAVTVDMSMPRVIPVSSLDQTERQCAEMVQGKVAWDRAGHRDWADESLVKLCLGTYDPPARIACFESGIRTHNDWARAISECTAPGLAR